MEKIGDRAQFIGNLPGIFDARSQPPGDLRIPHSKFAFDSSKLEVEGGYQRAKVKNANVSSTLLTDVSTASGVTATASDLGIGSKMGVKYLTANALLDSDFGGGFGGYAGAGVGRASVRCRPGHGGAAVGLVRINPRAF